MHDTGDASAMESGHVGTLHSIRNGFGFIQQDSGAEDIVVMPSQCLAFGGKLPEAGTRVLYNIGRDPKTQRLKAEDVIPEDFEDLYNPWPVEETTTQQPSVELPDGVFAGRIDENRGAYGFIRPDDGSTDLFVMPNGCEGGQIPPTGASVVYTMGTDQTQGEKNAGNVMAEELFRQRAITAAALQPQAASQGTRHGTMLQDNGKFGFISQDNGEGDMFVMPSQCDGYLLPAVGARVSFVVSKDHKTGRHRAENVRVIEQPPVSKPAESFAKPAPLPEGKYLGTMLMHQRKFGYIQQDNGKEDMFVLPGQCIGFGGRLPPDGTRVVFEIGMDPSSGRPRAEEVHPEASLAQASSAWASSTPDGQAPKSVATVHGLELQRGLVITNKGRIGYIKQDSGAADLFVTAGNCTNDAVPPQGTRVVYRVGTDMQRGLPIAESVQPEEQHRMSMMTQTQTGTMKTDNGTFGFIVQDSGGPDMFVMPAQCHAFDGLLPPVGTRLSYEVGADPKTKGLRAQDVRPQNPVAVQSYESNPAYGKAVKGKGFARGGRHPYVL